MFLYLGSVRCVFLPAEGQDPYICSHPISRGPGKAENAVRCQLLASGQDITGKVSAETRCLLNRRET
jgi:hypothetical protein